MDRAVPRRSSPRTGMTPLLNLTERRLVMNWPSTRAILRDIAAAGGAAANNASRGSSAAWDWATPPQAVTVLCRNCQHWNDVTLRGAPDRVIQTFAMLVGAGLGEHRGRD